MTSIAASPRDPRFVSARSWIAAVFDSGTFTATVGSAAARDPLRFHDRMPFAERVRDARERTGETESVVAGCARLDGRPVAVAAFEFDFLGGSLGSASADRLIELFELARMGRLPVVVRHASGGARMQEGTFALLQMARLAAAVQRFRSGREPFVSVLGHPTSGGVLASIAALGDVLIAEPGATIGFAGARVVHTALGRRGPEEVQRAEILHWRGLVDALCAPDQQRACLVGILDLLDRPTRLSTEDRPRTSSPSTATVRSPATRYERLRRTRHAQRAAFDLCVRRVVDGFFELRGDRRGRDDPAVRGGIARINGRPVMLVGIDRGTGVRDLARRNFGMPRPTGYRKALRLWELAERLALPVVNLVDTPGASPDAEAEEHGQAFAIAENLARLATLRTPVASLITGEGGSGGALAMLVGDHLSMLENATLSVISPEGCAAILWRDRSAAPQAAEQLCATAADLAAFRLVEAVVPEPGGDLRVDRDGAALAIRAHLTAVLAELAATPLDTLLERRARRLGPSAGFTLRRPP
jgi:acetyl-CoA carboxylase carboxyl transferase subunit beta